MMQFLSMVFGICSFIFRVKWAIWVALILYLSSYVNLRYCQEQKNFIMNLSLIMMAFFIIYFGPKKGFKKPDKSDTPKKYRRELWTICSGAKLSKLNNKSYYKKLSQISSEIPSWNFSIQIEKDLNRSRYRNDIQFMNKTRRILNNFSVRSPTIGYCQGFNFIVEFILSVIDDEVSKIYI